MHNENKRVMLGLELHAEILLDELASDMSSLLMPSKCHSSLQQDLSFPHTSGRLHMGKKRWTSSLGERWHQTHSCSTATTTGVWRAWSQSVLAGLYRRQRGFNSVLQTLVLSTLSDAVGCPPMQLDATLEGLDVQTGQVMGYGGSCTTSASPVGMSQTRQSILKGTETYF